MSHKTRDLKSRANYKSIDVILLASLPILRRRQNARYTIKASTSMAFKLVLGLSRQNACSDAGFLRIVTQQRPSQKISFLKMNTMKLVDAQLPGCY
jgi:hypothetical protein